VQHEKLHAIAYVQHEKLHAIAYVQQKEIELPTLDSSIFRFIGLVVGAMDVGKGGKGGPCTPWIFIRGTNIINRG